MTADQMTEGQITAKTVSGLPLLPPLVKESKLAEALRRRLGAAPAPTAPKADQPAQQAAQSDDIFSSRRPMGGREETEEERFTRIYNDPTAWSEFSSSANSDSILPR